VRKEVSPSPSPIHRPSPIHPLSLTHPPSLTHRPSPTHPSTPTYPPSPIHRPSPTHPSTPTYPSTLTHPDPTNELSRKSNLGFELLTPKYPRKTCFQETRFLLVLSRPIDFRGKPTSDSIFSPLITPGKKFDFEGVVTPQTFSAPAIFVSTRYNNFGKKKKISILRGVTPLPPDSPDIFGTSYLCFMQI
jgi:hypothetical protein